jgi:hypothetical protein
VTRKARKLRIVHDVQAVTPADYRAFKSLVTPRIATWDEKWGWSVIDEGRWESLLNACNMVELES